MISLPEFLLKIKNYLSMIDSIKFWFEIENFHRQLSLNEGFPALNTPRLLISRKIKLLTSLSG